MSAPEESTGVPAVPQVDAGVVPTGPAPSQNEPLEAPSAPSATPGSNNPNPPKRAHGRHHGDKDLRNIIVNHLDEALTEQEFRDMFTPFGTVETANLVAPKKTGKGATKYGFIVFKEKEAVIKAIRELNGKKCGRKQHAIRVAYAAAPGQTKGLEGKCENVYISGFTNLLSRDEIRQLYSEYGQVQEVKVMDTKAKNFSRGVAFVKYQSSAEAESAIVNTNKKRITKKMQQFELTVKYGRSEANKPGQTAGLPMGTGAGGLGGLGAMAGLGGVGGLAGAAGLDPSLMAAQLQLQMQPQLAQMMLANNPVEIEQYIMQYEGTGEENRIVVVENIPLECPYELLWTLFGQWGAISLLQLPALAPGINKGYAMVHFLDGASAATAVAATNGFQVKSGAPTLKVYHARVKPLQLNELGGVHDSSGLFIPDNTAQ
eukprot:TRINITY_DN2352_c0_g1_i3.p1 TRINITY_DN2352_c0_g1~~TRINITY_DN2352_c0_g1_i3.p1  ORF type:complete len:430 (+),score=164.74 TRINITY_DN2352_c0_g1_i3:135-1424(+)